MQTTNMEPSVAGSNSVQKIYEAQLQGGSADDNGLRLADNAFSTFFTWRGFGNSKLNCVHPAINSNSRVFISISEYNTDAAINRFIGAASMGVMNVAPYNGGVWVWISVGWDQPLNIRIDVMVEP